jgi:transposase-like protein
MPKRLTYTEEFKIEAVELADKIDNTAQSERDLGIPTDIYKWHKNLDEKGGLRRSSLVRGNLKGVKMKALR